LTSPILNSESWKNPSELLIIAHRGGLFYRPENTLAAFKNTFEMNMNWVECDIRITRDNIPVLVHDERISGNGGERPVVRDLDYKEIRRIDVGGGEYIPTLEQVLIEFGAILMFDLEIKELDAVDEVIRVVEKYIDTERVIITSFIPDALQSVRKLAPDIVRGLLVDRLTGRLAGVKRAIKAARLLGCDYFLPHSNRLSPEWSRAAHNEGLKVVPWTVNKIDNVEKMLTCQVDGLITDDPEAVRSMVDKLKK